jgi:hypothetical protein
MGRHRPAEHHAGARAGERARRKSGSEFHHEAAVHDARHYEEVLMEKIRYVMAAGAALFIASATAEAQLPGRVAVPRTTATTSSTSVPAGMCRIWIDGVPSNRQPAPTSCDVARARVPSNGRIIYGSGTRQPVYDGSYDPRYDPRRDSRSSGYDPRLDRNSGRYDRRYDDDYSRKQAKIREQYLKKQQKNREQYERKMQKAREQEARKNQRGTGYGNGHGQGKGQGHGHGNGNGGDHDRW